jgi:hypothetical protein
MVIIGYLQAHNQNENQITVSELRECARTPFFLVLSLMCKCSLFDYVSYKFETFDENSRAGDEAFVIHAWYCDLWVSAIICRLSKQLTSHPHKEPSPNDTAVFSFNFQYKIQELVKRDRRYTALPSSSSDEEASGEDEHLVHPSVSIAMHTICLFRVG